MNSLSLFAADAPIVGTVEFWSALIMIAVVVLFLGMIIMLLKNYFKR